jgi:hypothetical protein
MPQQLSCEHTGEGVGRGLHHTSARIARLRRQKLTQSGDVTRVQGAGRRPAHWPPHAAWEPALCVAHADSQGMAQAQHLGCALQPLARPCAQRRCRATRRCVVLAAAPAASEVRVSEWRARPVLSRESRRPGSQATCAAAGACWRCGADSRACAIYSAVPPNRFSGAQGAVRRRVGTQQPEHVGHVRGGRPVGGGRRRRGCCIGWSDCTCVALRLCRVPRGVSAVGFLQPLSVPC